MGKFSAVVVIVVVGVIAASGALLATWDIPAPAERVEIVLDNERFPR